MRPIHYLLLLLIALFVALCSTGANAAADATLSPAQRLWVTQHSEIRVAADPEFEPIDFFDAEGHQRGLAADYLKLISARGGLTFRIVRSKSAGAALEALRQHRVDMLASAFTSPQRNSFALYSAPYLRLSAALYARDDDPTLTKIDQLAGRKLGLVTDHVWKELIGDAAAKLAITSYPNIASALAALAHGEVDAYAGDTVSAASAISRIGKSRIALAGPLGLEAPLGFAIRSDWPELKDILDAVLKEITVDEEKNLRERWLKNTTADSNPVGDASVPPPVAHTEEITAVLAALPRQRGLTAEQRQRSEELLRQALDDEQHADQAQEQWQSMQQIGVRVGEETRRLEETLAHDNTAELLAWRSNLPERASVEQLETLLLRERNAMLDARNRANTLRTELDQQAERPAQIRDELAAARSRLEQTGAPAEVNATSIPLATALRLRTQAAQRLALTQIAQLETENRSYEARMRLLSAQLRDQQRQASVRAEHVGALENLVLDRSGAQVAELQARLKHEREQLSTSVPILEEAADANLTIGEELAANVARLGEVRALKDDYSHAHTDTEQALKHTQERLQIGGVSEAVGLILLAERRKLRPLAVLKHQLAALQTELARTRIRLIDLREQQTSLDDISTAVSQELTRMDSNGANPAELHQNLYQLLNTRAELIARLIEAQTRLTGALSETEQELDGLATVTDTLTTTLDARLLWTPSHSAIGLGWLLQLPRDQGRFMRPQPWLDAAQRGWQHARAHPLLTLLGLLSLIALFVVRYRVPALLEQLATPLKRIRTDRYRYTGSALLLTALAASVWPWLLWLCAKLWQPAAESIQPFSDALAVASSNLVLGVYAVAFLTWLCTDKGLAHLHFRWPRTRRDALLRIARWFALGLLPLQFLLSLILAQGDEGIISSVGRALFALSCLLFAIVVWNELRPGTLWTLRDVVLPEPSRLRQFTRISLFSFSILLLLLPLAGYFLTALGLAEHLLQSLALLLGGATLYGMATRWLVLGERRLALKRMEEKREAEAASSEVNEGSEALPEPPEVEALTLANVSAQTRHLLRAVTVVLFSATLLWIWSDIAPALSFLGKFIVWDSTSLTGSTETALHITLRDVLASIVVLALTSIATRNLPGLLEVGLLRRLQIDAPTRYALTSVLRYLIVIVGTIFGIGLLGVQWSHMQWLVAGLTVGLGFGLQEIFANFISGLIVLFERPIRIGDVVSIGNVEGTIARIRTRATTIIDWDHKEVVVPNKTFITERLINWTLSDTMTRVVIKVGVVYGSDIAQVQRLLIAVATDHPLVLKEPAPNCWMMGFGANTLDFELRVFVAEINQRNLVRTDLQQAIITCLRENGIDMSLPQQMDVWLHRSQGQSSATSK